MTVINQIRRDLVLAVDPRYKDGSQIIFKGDQSSKIYGVRVPVVRRLAAKFYPEVKGMPKQDFFRLVEALLMTDYLEEALVGFVWLRCRQAEFDQRDFVVFERWLKKYINNWPKCDDFCPHIIGFLLQKYPELLPRTLVWARSKKRFVKRAAAVSLLTPIRHQNVLPQVFQVAEVLLEDSDDLVQKGYGWLLKVAADFYREEVLAFVMDHKSKMPRTALRYAIEKMPPNVKRQAMA